jgi:regulator of protease activity HflC (stomatin/prohibitin superfamily)
LDPNAGGQGDRVTRAVGSHHRSEHVSTMSEFNPLHRSSHNGNRGVRLIVTAVVAVIALGVIGSLLSGVVAKTGPGEVAVVRNGGPAAAEIRFVLEPASSLTWAGFFHATHTYPASQRFYTITADPAGGDKPGVDVESVPTKDGVQVGIEATVYFTLNTDPSVLSSFDDKYGNRTFRSFDGAQLFAWDGADGWSAFLDQIVRPVISNNFREQIGNFRCQELVASCALVQNNGNATGAAVSGSNQNNVNIAKVQEAVRTGLIQDVSSTLGGPFIENFQVNLVKVSLPENVQQAVNSAQAAFAQVTEAQARVQSAKADAQANEERQRGYAACPACAAIDQLKAIPPTITTYAPGAGFAVTPGTK